MHAKAGIHAYSPKMKEDVDGRDKPGHYDRAGSFAYMTDPQHEPPETDADRRKANIALLVGAIILIGGGIWLVNALLDARDAEICMESGRRNCNPIDVPAR
jgi:hypothetical protein